MTSALNAERLVFTFAKFAAVSAGKSSFTASTVAEIAAVIVAVLVKLLSEVGADNAVCNAENATVFKSA